MHPISAPWTTWWQDDLPCRFSREDTVRNLAFLMDMIGAEWLRKALQPRSNHPLIAEWMTNGANAFLLLNALAEDARLLTSVPGFDEIVRDLRENKQCQPSWHVIRAAAMFQRGGAAVSKFYDQSDERAPDFLIRFNSIEVNVEAKLLLESDLEDTFHEYAQPLGVRVFAEAMTEELVHPPVTIVLKSIATLPDYDEVVHAVSKLLHDAKLPPKNHRGAHFNIFIDPPPVGNGLFRQYHVLCPRSNKENLRVATRIKTASRQLLSERAAGHPGIFWLGVTRHQSAPFLRTMLMRKFDDGEYAGVSQVFLLQSGTHLEPPRRSVIDYGTQIVNSKSRTSLPVKIPVKPLDLVGELMALHGSEPGLPAYRVGAVQTRVGPGMPPLRLPDLRRVDQQSLE